MLRLIPARPHRPLALFALSGLAALCLAPAASAQAPRYTLTDLSALSSPASVSSTTVALNGAGQTAYSLAFLDATQNSYRFHAFLYSGGALSDLGNLGAGSSGERDIETTDLNGSGQVIGQASIYDSAHTFKGRDAFLYSEGTLLDLGNFGTTFGGAGFSSARAINASGQVAGQSDIYDSGHTFQGSAAFLYAGGKVIRIGGFGADSSGYSYSGAAAINAAGVVVGSANVYDASHVLQSTDAFVYANGVMTDLGTLGGPAPQGQAFSDAEAINGAGLIVGTSSVYGPSSTYQGYKAFLYTGGKMVPLGDFGTDSTGTGYSTAEAVNEAGQVAGSSEAYDDAHTDKGRTAFLYSGGKMTPLGTLSVGSDGRGDSFVTALNDAGQVIGGYHDYASPDTQSQDAFVYSGGTLYDLRSLIANGAGWTDLRASAINDAGQISGSGTHNGRQEAFLLTPQSSHGHLLWTSPDGRAVLWFINPDGTFGDHGAYGPYRDVGGTWRASAVATGPDGVSRLLWTSPDGRAVLWSVNPDGTYTDKGAYGPYTDGGGTWRASAVSVGPDNIAHVLWTNPDGRAVLWFVNPDGSFGDRGAYGPYRDGGGTWRAGAVATGPDGVSRLLWTHPDGRAVLWSISPDGTYTDKGAYGPYADGGGLWKAGAVSVGPDNVAHLLWTHPDGQAVLWYVNPDGAHGILGIYGPYADSGGLWRAGAVATGPDGVSHILWGNPDGRAVLWYVNADGTYGDKGAVGPYADAGGVWRATSASAGP